MFAFTSTVTGGRVPREYVHAVEAGRRDALGEGPLGGHPVIGVRVTLTDGATHPKDSSELAFRAAGRLGLREALRAGVMVMLEPFVEVTVVVPEDAVGAVLGDLAARRGRVTGSTVRHGAPRRHRAVGPRYSRRRRRRMAAVRPPSGSEPPVTSVLPGTTRNTRQRTDVLALLELTDGFRSAQELHAELRGRGAKVGLTTVYRTLQLLTDAGEVDQVRLPDGEQRYRRCAQSTHHHHLVCRVCGTAVEVEGPAVERWADEQASRHGFVDVAHTMEIVGTCGACTGNHRG